jgi:hypothetical protein
LFFMSQRQARIIKILFHFTWYSSSVRVCLWTLKLSCFPLSLPFPINYDDFLLVYVYISFWKIEIKCCGRWALMRIVIIKKMEMNMNVRLYVILVVWYVRTSNDQTSITRWMNEWKLLKSAPARWSRVL